MTPPALITIETNGERGEIRSKTPSGTFLSFSALSVPPDRAKRSMETRGRGAKSRVKIMSRIAIYEENDLMRALLKEWLSEAGYRVRAAAPPAAQREGTEDLVIASVYMPKRAGAQLLREVQATHPGTPVIAISGQFLSGLSAVGATAQMLGVQRVLAKPLSRGDLLEAVRAMIGPPG